MALKLIKPNWPAANNITAFTTTRLGGVSKPPYDSLNLALHVKDNPQNVATNRQLVADLLPSQPYWLNQTHSDNIAILEDVSDLILPFDASVTTQKNKICAVMTADCLPLLMTNKQGSVVMAVHAGWQGLVNRIVVKSIGCLVSRYNVNAKDLLVWLGPAISSRHFEIGDEVKCKLQASMVTQSDTPFVKGDKSGKWFADVYQIAREQLLEVGVSDVYGGEYCTYEDDELFFSHRRATHQGSSSTGRMVSVICLDD